MLIRLTPKQAGVRFRGMEAPMEKKTFRYTVTFTVETSRQMKPEDLEQKAADVWDDTATVRDRKLFVDSYGFTASKA